MVDVPARRASQWQSPRTPRHRLSLLGSLPLPARYLALPDCKPARYLPCLPKPAAYLCLPRATLRADFYLPRALRKYRLARDVCCIETLVESGRVSCFAFLPRFDEVLALSQSRPASNSLPPFSSSGLPRYQVFITLICKCLATVERCSTFTSYRLTSAPALSLEKFYQKRASLFFRAAHRFVQKFALRD